MSPQPREIELAAFASIAPDRCALLIIANGYEDRALAVPRALQRSAPKQVLVVRYAGAGSANDSSESALKQVFEGWPATKISWIEYAVESPPNFSGMLRANPEVPTAIEAGEVWFDVSGFTHFGAASTLSWVRRTFPDRTVRILYCEARTYYPTLKDWHTLQRRRSSALPESLSVDMDSSVLTDEFTGFALRDQSTLLVLFPGYEPHRTLGLINEYNPQKILLVYTQPDRPSLLWRLEMSQWMHRDIINARPVAQEVYQSTDVAGVRSCLFSYYDHLYDDHNLIVAPACSKLHGVAAFQLWETYRDVQLVFTKPVQYLPERSCSGVGRSFEMRLDPPPRLLNFAKDVSEEQPSLPGVS